MTSPQGTIPKDLYCVSREAYDKKNNDKLRQDAETGFVPPGFTAKVMADLSARPGEVAFWGGVPMGARALEKRGRPSPQTDLPISCSSLLEP